MASATGTATIDFGSAPGKQETSVVITGQATISATSKCEAWIMGDDSTTNHTAADHKYAPLFAAFTCGAPVAATGFTIYGRSTHKLTGQFALRWVWSD